MKRLLSSDPEGFDGPCGELLHRLYSRRQEIKTRLHQIEGNLLDGNLEGTSEHNRWVGNRCAPLIDDYVVVFNSGGISRRRRVWCDTSICWRWNWRSNGTDITFTTSRLGRQEILRS